MDLLGTILLIGVLAGMAFDAFKEIRSEPRSEFEVIEIKEATIHVSVSVPVEETAESVTRKLVDAKFAELANESLAEAGMFISEFMAVEVKDGT